VKIAGDIALADSLIVLSHFKGHLLSGFGGAIKNLGMGCAPPIGKGEQHSARPIFNPDLCPGCGQCAKTCPTKAIIVETKIASIDYNSCTGCGECLRACPTHALDFDWMVQVPPFLERMVEYAWGPSRKSKENWDFLTSCLISLLIAIAFPGAMHLSCRILAFWHPRIRWR